LGESRPDELLDSWKEIAAHLGRDVRTVQRWEKKEALPVHRHEHEKMGTVYAYKSEIDAWWSGRSSRLASKAENGGMTGGPQLVSWPSVTPQMTGAEELAAATPWPRVRRLTVYAVAIAGLLFTAFAFYEIVPMRSWRRKPPLEGMRIARLTFTGQVKDAAISPDGKYVAFVNLERGKRSVWVYHTATGSTAQVVSDDIGYWPWGADRPEFLYQFY
jgi:hypothetical protein